MPFGTMLASKQLIVGFSGRCLKFVSPGCVCLYTCSGTTGMLA